MEIIFIIYIYVLFCAGIAIHLSEQNNYSVWVFLMAWICAPLFIGYALASFLGLAITALQTYIDNNSSNNEDDDNETDEEN